MSSCAVMRGRTYSLHRRTSVASMNSWPKARLASAIAFRILLMANHLQPPSSRRSTFVLRHAELAFRYTRYSSARLKRVGHLFEGRFKAPWRPVAMASALVRYIQSEPVRARIVAQPSTYSTAATRAYLKGGSPLAHHRVVLGHSARAWARPPTVPAASSTTAKTKSTPILHGGKA